MPSTTPPTDLTRYSAVACNYSQRTRIATLVSDPVVLETRGPEDELLEILESYRENYRRVAARR